MLLKKCMIILGFVLALTFVQGVQSESRYLAAEDDEKIIDWFSYERVEFM